MSISGESLGLWCRDSFAKTHPGLQRTNNEDAAVSDPKSGVFVLADGMGGHPGGEVASVIATAEAHRSLAAVRPGRRDPAFMRTAFDVANRAVLDHGRTHPRVAGMGATLVAVALRAGGSSMLVAHAGDSRVYLLRGKALTALTKDHGQGHVVERAIGLQRDVVPDVMMVRLMRDDRILLCSDGLTKSVPDETVRSILFHSTSCKDAAWKLVDATLDEGAPDNVTVIVVSV